ncbi:GNAT family N-acetyltransferase [Celeribacter arenosi]|uniref:GNAT family N-acetyltransferase n=1 Tax=Celeribacter arenosi TaxID=792649 RepID=A0ABP7JVW7_9RHOB
MSGAVRRATRDDIAAMADIVVAWEAETPWTPPAPDGEQIAAMFHKMFEAREIWVAGDPVTGYLALDPEKSHITGLYMRARGQGLGKALVDKAKEGRSVITLNTHVANLDAQRFYVREGFVALHEMAPAKEGDPQELRMEWRA